MINNSTNINKTNSNLSPLVTNHRKTIMDIPDLLIQMGEILISTTLFHRKLKHQYCFGFFYDAGA
jgi:hypothetical protein